MFWSIKENTGGLAHLLDGWYRVVFGLRQDRFLSAFEKSGFEKIHAVKDVNGEPALCKLCGHSQVRATLSGGWELEACSAVFARAGIEKYKLAKLLSRLEPQENRQEDIEEIEKVESLD